LSVESSSSSTGNFPAAFLFEIWSRTSLNFSFFEFRTPRN